MRVTIYNISLFGKKRFYKLKRFISTSANGISKQTALDWIQQDRERNNNQDVYKLDTLVKDMSMCEVGKALPRKWLSDFNVEGFCCNHLATVDRTLKACRKWYGKRRQFCAVYQLRHTNFIFAVPVDDTSLVVRIR